MTRIGATRVIGDLLEGVSHAPSVQRFTMDGAEGLDWLAAGIRGAEQRIVGHNSGINNPAIVDAFAAARESGVPVHLLSDPEFIGAATHAPLREAGAELVSWGGNAYHPTRGFDHRLNPRKIHAKHVTFDDRSWVSTASMSSRSATNVEATAILGDADSRALIALTERGLVDDGAGLVAAADAARAQGILLNDLSYGIDHLTAAYEGAIRGASSELVVGFKVLEDKRMAKLLRQATARGVEVHLATAKKLPKRIRNRLDPEALVRGRSKRLHANAVVADRSVAVFGSAHASTRALVRGETRRASHELGIATDDAAVVDAIRSALLTIAH